MITAQDIKNAVHDMDIMLRPYSILYNPKDENNIPREIVDCFDMVATPLAMEGKIYVVDRRQVEKLITVDWMDL